MRRPDSPGLVSSETSPLEISLDAAAQRRRRIKRLRRSVWQGGSLHGQVRPGFRPDVCHFVTLTYVGVDDWRADHISKATEQFRRYCERIGVPCKYVWVAELQRRGAVHYHLLAWLPRGVYMPHWDAPSVSPSGRRVRAFWSHGMTNTQQARAGVGYLMKYLSKLDEVTKFPPHLRLYGLGGLSPSARAIRAWTNLPEWAKNEHGVGELRREGARLIVWETGEIVPPMYRPQFEGGSLLLQPLRPRSPRLHDGPYSRLEAWRTDTAKA